MAGAALRYGETDEPGDARRGEEPRAGASTPTHALREFALVSDLHAFAALEPEWNRLFDSAGRGAQLFQTFNWNWHWCRRYLAGGKASLAIVTGRLDKRLALVWPLVIERSAGLRVLTWMGFPVSQYGDVLIDDRVDAGPLLKEAWDFVTGRLKPDLVWLRKVRADSPLTPFLSKVGAIETLRTEAPFMDLDAAGDFQAHLQRRSARFRKRQRVASKRLAELGFVAYERRTQGSEAGDRARGAIELKRAQLAHDGVLSPALADPRMVEFFAAIAAARDRPVGLNVDALAINGDLAAVNMFIGCKDRAALHVIAYDLRFQKAGVGSLLLQHTIAEANAAGYRTFDFLAPADDYKLKWADGVVPVSDWAVPLSWKGHAFARAYLGLARPALKSLFNALPLTLRRFIADQRGS